MSINSARIEKIESQLNVWEAKIKLLEAKMENTGSDIKLQHARDLDELREKKRIAMEKLKEMKMATNETLGQVKGAADKAWNSLKTGFAKARSNFTS